MNITYQKGYKFGAAVTSLGMYYTSNKICPRKLSVLVKLSTLLPLLFDRTGNVLGGQYV